jgi:uncharacterized protein (DUF2164 family)
MAEEHKLLSKEDKQRLVSEIQHYISAEWDTDIGLLKAELLLDFMEGVLGKAYYNKAVDDARQFFLRRAEALELDMDQLKR